MIVAPSRLKAKVISLLYCHEINLFNNIKVNYSYWPFPLHRQANSFGLFSFKGVIIMSKCNNWSMNYRSVRRSSPEANFNVLITRRYA